MPSTWNKFQFYLYKYFITGFFVLTLPIIGYLGILDVIGNVISIFSTVALIWSAITFYLVKLSWGMTLEEFIDKE